MTIRIESRINTNEVARQNENFKDLDLDFIVHPRSKDLVKKTGANAIKRSIRNLLFLKPGELGFKPNKGSGIYHALFQPFTPATVSLLEQEILHTINRYEPRVKVFAVEATDDLDKNGINIGIYFEIINYNEPHNLDIFIERVR